MDLLIYFLFLSGYIRDFFFKSSELSNDIFQYGIGFVALLIFMKFWKRFLFLNVYMPRLNIVFDFLFYLGIIFAILFFLEFFSIEVMEVFARFYILFSMVTSVYSSIYTYKQKFTPALYSVFGLPISFVFTSIYYYSGIGFLSGNDFTRNSIYYGFLIEFLVFLYSLSIRFNFLSYELKENSRSLDEMEVEFSLKIKKSRVKSIDAEFFLKKLNNLMVEEKLFCDEDLKLARLADILEIRPDQLSEIINSQYNKNFNTYLNDFRIAEAKELLSSSENRSILSIALSCGFNSKSSFNVEFKKREGITPREFKEFSSKS